MKGVFITIEGGEGSGKSTQLKNIENWLKENNLDAVFTFEPGGTELGAELREILKHASYHIGARAETMLFNSARSELVESVIKPALKDGKVVVCDRFYDSNVVYQGLARGEGEEFVNEVIKLAVNGCEPDMTLWLDITPLDAFKRKGGADVGDRFEQSGLEFHNKVYEGFKYLSKKHPERIVRIDATKNIEDVTKQVVNALEKCLRRK